MAGQRPYLPVNPRSWLLEIGNRLRAEYAASQEPVPERLAKLIAQLEAPPPAGAVGPVPSAQSAAVPPDRPAPADSVRPPAPQTEVRECRAA
jgi:anti-sigma factor NepR-like protein